ncbi:hypothetical protein [Xanthomonas euvesicatoria]|uniref:hypothetical protein n=1 Tax=Xanthomonas euvesicatoria TaxID=456327 RepID=UPI0023598BBD|nr:hypothetical protein [Xanthomonas euvesicatoria]MDC9668595.1 hypothetical protein [Xanthomonas euvesicatoria]
MATPSPQLEAALASFAASGASQDQVAQLRGALVADPKLMQQFDQEAIAGHLRGFALQAAKDGLINGVGG